MRSETVLVSHGFGTRCQVCKHQQHAKWHEYARGEINPVALIQFVESLQPHAPAVTQAIAGWVFAVTGMDVDAMRAALAEEAAAEKVEGR